MANVLFRPARPDDAEALTELAHAAKRHWGYDEAWIALWRPALTFTRESLEALRVVVAEDAGAPVGVAAVSTEGAQAELEHLWIHPSHRGTGLGRALLAHAAAKAREAGALTLGIDSDPHAEAFYRRQGAVRVGSVPSTPEGRSLPRLVLRLL